MDGWDRELACCRQPKNFAYAYTPRKEIAPYWDMAKQYVLADRMFQSNLDGSFVAHQYAIAGYAAHAVDYPSSEWGCSGGTVDKVPTLRADRTVGRSETACFRYTTIATEADAARVSWRFYTGSITGDGGLWNAYQAIDQIYNGPDWNVDVVNPPAQVLTDVGAGTTAANSRQSPGSRRPMPPQIMPGWRRRRPGVDSVRRRRHRREPVLGLDGDLHHVGRLGRLVRSRYAGV